MYKKRQKITLVIMAVIVVSLIAILIIKETCNISNESQEMTKTEFTLAINKRITNVTTTLDPYYQLISDGNKHEAEYVNVTLDKCISELNSNMEAVRLMTPPQSLKQYKTEFINYVNEIIRAVSLYKDGYGNGTTYKEECDIAVAGLTSILQGGKQ